MVHLEKPLRLGVVNGWWGWQPELPGPGKGWGQVRPPPPLEMGVKMFELAQTNLFNPERKKGGGAPTGDLEPVAQGDDGVEGCGGYPGPAIGPGCPG